MGTRRSLYALTTAGIVVFAVASVVSGQDETPATPTMRQLLAEVRGLRADMAAASTAGIRAQVLIGRLQMQEQRIAAVGQQLTEVQTNVAALEQAHDASVARTRHLENARGTAEQREANERELDALAVSNDIDAKRLSELRGQEAVLQGQLDQEQARWQDVNSRLEDLEHTLAR